MDSRRRVGWRLVLLLFLIGPLLALVFPALPVRGAEFVLFQLRIPRLLGGILVGGTLGLSGAVTQAVFHNPLATPSTTGSIAGATLGALMALVFGAGGTVLGFSVLVLAAFAGALLTSGIVTAAAINGRARTEDVLLVGIAVTLAASAVATAIQDMGKDSAVVVAARWSLGYLGQVGYARIALAAPLLLVSWVLSLSLIRPLQTLALGEETAHARGVHVVAVRTLSLGAAALGVAIAVAWCGPIGFIGLIVPQLVRLAFGGAIRSLLPLSLAAGAGLLVLCDALGRLVVPGRELPVGVVTALVGAPALAGLVASRRPGP